MDIFATAASLTSYESPRIIDGVSLLPVFRDPKGIIIAHNARAIDITQPTNLPTTDLMHHHSRATRVFVHLLWHQPDCHSAPRLEGALGHDNLGAGFGSLPDTHALWLRWIGRRTTLAASAVQPGSRSQRIRPTVSKQCRVHAGDASNSESARIAPAIDPKRCTAIADRDLGPSAADAML
jgi:hypothetical protein